METKIHVEITTCEKEKRKRKQRKHSITLEAHKNKDKKLIESHTQDNECIYKKTSKRKKLSEKEVDLDNKKLKKEESRHPLDNTEKLNSEAALEQKNHEVDEVGNDDSNKLKQTENSSRDKIFKEMEITNDKIISMMDADQTFVTVNSNDSVKTCLSVTLEKIQNSEINDLSDQVTENITVESILKDTEDNVLASNDNEEEKENISHINASVDTKLKLASPNLTDEKDIVSESIINSNTSRPTSGEMDAQSLEEIGLPSGLTGEEKVVMLEDDETLNRKSYTPSPVNNCDNLNSTASFKSKDITKNKHNVANKNICEDTICEENSKEENIKHKSQETLVQILTTTKTLSTDSKVDGIQSMCLNENDMKANIITSKENEHTCVQENHAISIPLSDENKSRSLTNEGHEFLEEKRLIVQNTICNTQHENFGENEYSIQENKNKSEQRNSKNKNLEEATTRKKRKLSEIGKTKNVTTNLEAVNMKLELVVANKIPNVTIDEVPEILNTIDQKIDSYANDETNLNSINNVNDGDTGKNYETVNDNYTANDNVSVNNKVTVNNNGTINDSKSVIGCKIGNDNSNNSSNVNKSDDFNDDETVNKDNNLTSDRTTVGNNDNDTANDIVNDNNTSNDHVTMIVNKTDNIKNIDLFPTDEINNANNTKHNNISENENIKNNQKQIHTKKPISFRNSEHKTVAIENESINENSCENAKNSNRLNISKYQELMISNTEKPDDMNQPIEDVESKTNNDALINLYDNHSNEEQPKGVHKNIEMNVKLITEYDRLEILKKECLERQVKVNLQRLTVSAVLDAKLNNPKVLLKPLNYEKFLTEKLKSQIKETIETEESKTVCNATTVEVSQIGMKRSRRTCAAIRFRPTSSSSTDSFDDYKRKPRSSRSKRPKTNVSTKSYATKKTLVVTPRSSSGLKLRITSNEALHSVTRISIDNKLVPIINIPTSSSEEETDPLYLEEVEFVRCD
ncbi:putative uncharacterized protein DDB_G0282133 [Teleopsis dalmanni]|uniref:putative uncharacterized protein DDB_G0282133 n=1 Tax=Teleopsis dalmanni TaxID=139649 RepID=UPI0018CD17A7|nr:putative uncharacterized protein DDB_G0282133 [Teleopsis dalmanni]